MKTCQILFARVWRAGILFAGKFLAYKGLLAGKQVSWLPSYGPEMRGGTANWQRHRQRCAHRLTDRRPARCAGCHERPVVR